MAIKEIIDAERLTHNFSLNRIQAAADRRIAEVESDTEAKDKVIAELVKFLQDQTKKSAKYGRTEK